MKNLILTLATIALMAWPAQALAAGTHGDVNHDGATDITDVTDLIDYLLNPDADGVQSFAGDVNCDGIVDINDVTALIDVLLGLPVSPSQRVTINANGVEFTMVLVKGGTFTMGATEEQLEFARRNEYPAHEVTLWSYYIGQTEVTQALWLAVMGENPSCANDNLNCPVDNVSLFDCAKFVDRLTELTGYIFRMPTEAEWEFAARGGNLSRHFVYAGSNDVSQVAWYDEVSGVKTHPVALLQPNELGLYDMSGNVCEWCQDWYVLYDDAPQINPVGPESGTDNVYRGGSWCHSPVGCRVSSRYDLDPHEKAANLGLRIVMNY